MFRPVLRRVKQQIKSQGKSNRQIFDEIYGRNHWGGEGIYSGADSEEANSGPYEELVARYIVDHDIGSIVDIGCGDFQVSQRILARLPDTVSYLGLDVSQLVVARNTKLFASDRIAFAQCDASRDDLPPADLVLVREVLQHLSNKTILAILPKLARYPHAIVSNTRSKGAAAENVDLASGASSRAGIGSGLWLELAPFNQPLEELLVLEHKHYPTEIVTVRLAR